jgi:hypothetical protein
MGKYFKIKSPFSQYLILFLLYFLFSKSAGTHNRSYYIYWIKSLLEGNILSLYHVVNADIQTQKEDLTVPYPPASLYLLGAVCKFLLLFMKETDSTYIFGINIVGILCTFATAILLGKFQSESTLKTGYRYLYFPAVILISPILGFQDTIFSFFVLLTLFNISKSRYILVGISTALSIWSKQLALIPIAGLIIIFFFQTPKLALLRFALAFSSISAIILSPFILTGNFFSYLESQTLTSVHTMLSAQASNYPWLISFFIRIFTEDKSQIFDLNGNGLRFEDSLLRQACYIGAAFLTIIIFITWLIIWSKKIQLKNIDPGYAAALLAATYNLFNFGVHENHIYMLLPILYVLARDRRMKWAFYSASTALALQLLATNAFGDSLSKIAPLTSSNPLLYVALVIFCVIGFSVSFFFLVTSNPMKLNESSTTEGLK